MEWFKQLIPWILISWVCLCGIKVQVGGTKIKINALIPQWDCDYNPKGGPNERE